VLRSDPERLGWELGEAVESTAPRVIANVFDDDLGPIRAVIEDPQADEGARGAMIQALGALLHQGRVPRAEVVSYLRTCPATFAVNEEMTWISWSGVVADLGLAELRDVAERAFDDGSLDEGWISRKELRRALDGKKVPASMQLYEPFGDVEKELADWEFFDPTEAELGDDAAMADDDEGAFEPLEPAVNPLRHVGRNDPCPCGSGKKFKKCCGR
jgi:hypothetical protein